MLCRAFVDLATADAATPHVIVDVDVGAGVARAVLPGLVVRDGEDLYLLRLHPHSVSEQGPRGRVDREWQMLMGVAAPDGSPIAWHGYPATLAPPDAPAPAGAVYREVNGLTILGVFGPFVALRASLTGRAEAPGDFDHSRYAWVRAPGAGADPLDSLGGDALREARRALAERATMAGVRPLEIERHDFRRSAVLWSRGALRLRTLVPCCVGAPESLPAEIEAQVEPGRALARDLPDEAGAFVGPRGCGAIRLHGDRLLARRGNGALHPVPIADLRPRTLLGVVWVKPGDRRGWDDLKSAASRL